VDSKQRQLLGLAGWLATSFAAAAIGAVASIHAKSIYTQLAHPSWAPAATVFGPVWTVLYAMMGVAAWLAWRSGGFRSNRLALSLFLAQLVLNARWSWLFFVLHQGALALIDISVLWLLIAPTVVLFWRVRPAAGMLLVPYLAWVSFACTLNYSVWQLNPGILGPTNISLRQAMAGSSADVDAHTAHQSYVAAINSNNLDTLLGVLTDDVVFMPPNDKPRIGKSAVGPWIGEYLRTYHTHWDKPVQEFIVSGDWAFERYAYTSIDTPVQGGAPIVDTGWGLVIYHHDRDGRWRVARDAWGSDHTAPVK
jgi:tryptophan-rich sensory protein